MFTIGLPLVGEEVLTGQRRHIVADTRDVCKLIELGFIHEIIPVGSRGILHEAKVMAEDSKLRFKPDRNARTDLTNSAGPATVILFAQSKSYDAVKQISKPITQIGTLLQ